MTRKAAVEEQAIRCLVALGAGAAEEAAAAVAQLLDEPPGDVIRWLADAVLSAAAALPPAELVGVVGPGFTRPGIVAETVEALRRQDPDRLYAVAGGDLIDLVLHLAGCVVALDAAGPI